MEMYGFYNKLVTGVAQMIYENSIIFKDLLPSQMELVRPLFIHMEKSAGSILFEQGEQAGNLFIVLDGEVEVKYKPEDGPALVVTRIRPEGVVGWSAALGNPNYTSSAICATNCELLSVGGDDLRRLCEQNPDLCPIILERLAAMIAKRLRNTHNHVIDLLKQGLGIQLDIPEPVESLQDTT